MSNKGTSLKFAQFATRRKKKIGDTSLAKKIEIKRKEKKKERRGTWSETFGSKNFNSSNFFHSLSLYAFDEHLSKL